MKMFKRIKKINKETNKPVQLLLVFKTSNPYDMDENPIDTIIINIKEEEKDKILDKVSELITEYKKTYSGSWNYQDAVERTRNWLYKNGYCEKTDKIEIFDVEMH